MATIATFAAFSSRGYSAAGGKILPTGGDYVIDNNGAGKRVHVFTSPGTFTIPTGGPITGKFTEIEVLCVGAGGDASSDQFSTLNGSGGGGGGGSVVYDSSYRIPIGHTINVYLSGDGFNIAEVDGMPAAAAGGRGGTADDYSKGWPGGSGGGGSWQNAIPNGPDYSVAHPGWTYGNTGPSAPTNTKYFMPIVLNNPAQTSSNVANAVSRTWNSSLYNSTKGNGQYGCSSEVPDSTKGLAGNRTFFGASPGYAAVTGTFYSPKAFRMRGGGGSSYIGPLGGQGILTDFHNLENGTYEWMGAGGNGVVIDNWATWKAAGYDTYGLRDSGVYNGTFYEGGENWISSPSQVNWSTSADNITVQTWQREVRGRYSYGSGGSNEAEQDGQHGTIILRYDLNAFPGGADSAAANVFGGNITTSANGRFRYHIWSGDSRAGPALRGTSANSQTWIAFNDHPGYRLRSFYGDGGGDYEWYNYKDGQDGRPNGANTDPFYYYADVPSFTVQYFMIGAGGSAGTRGDPNQSWSFALVPGGGGSGAISVGSFGTPSVAISSSPNFPSLASDLANASNTLVTNFGYSTMPAFNHRGGYVEVRANSLLNSRLSTNQYVDQIPKTTEGTDPYVASWNNSREQSATIRIRGSDNTKARLLRRDKYFILNNGYFGNSGTAFNGDEQYLVLNSDFLGDPDSEGWGASIYLDSGYDHYYYNNYVRARAGRRGVLFVDQNDESSAPTTGAGDTQTAPDVNLVNRAFSLGTYYGGGPANFTTDATGTHPATGEPYYNAIRFTEGLRKWSKASDDIPNDRWTPFYNVLNTYNASKYDNPYYWNGTTDVRVTDSFTQCNKFGTPGNQQFYSRSIEFNYANTNGTIINNKFRNLYGNVDKQVKIQWVEECCDNTSLDFGKRRFRYIDHWGNDDFRLDIDAGWKAITPAVTQRIATYTNESDELVRTYVQVWRRDLRRLVIRHLFAMDISVGSGGKGNKQGSARRRSGGATSIHFQNSNTPNYTAGPGGAGGWNEYTRQGEYYDQESMGGDQQQYRSNRSPNTFAGAGVGTSTMVQGTITAPSTPAGSGGGAAWWMGYTQSLQQYPTPGGVGGPNGSPSNNLVAAAGGGGGGGSISTRDLDMGAGLNTFKLGGATRGSGASGFSNGRQTRRNLGDADSGHGGRGYFGGTSPWTHWFGSSVNLNGTDTYYALSINQFPFNAEFSAGGGGGAGGDGGDGNLSTGGNGGAGVAYSLTGFSTIYGAGGGGFGRKINGSPGSSMPADPSAVSVPAGAPDGPAFKPYGIGGGWSPGSQEGGGADGGASQYYPGSGPWPNATPVSAGQAHMDAMRYFNSSIPAPQLGSLGSRYSGGPGVVIIAYNRAPYYT